MTDDIKLLPCPFCGASAKATDEMFGSVIHCDHLHTCPLDGHEQLAAAVREWNTRAAPAEDVREVVDEPLAVRDFANEMINAAYEGGAFDAGDIQDLAVKHGLLSIEPRAEACGECCRCGEYGFPTECLRKTILLKPAQ